MRNEENVQFRVQIQIQKKNISEEGREIFNYRFFSLSKNLNDGFEFDYMSTNDANHHGHVYWSGDEVDHGIDWWVYGAKNPDGEDSYPDIICLYGKTRVTGKEEDLIIKLIHAIDAVYSIKNYYLSGFDGNKVGMLSDKLKKWPNQKRLL